MVAGVPRARPSESVAELRARLREGSYDESSTIAVVEDHRLRGLVRTEELLQAPDRRRCRAWPRHRRHRSRPSRRSRLPPSRWSRPQAPAIAVADRAGRFLGLVPSERVIKVLLLEHDEDLARIGGYRSSARRARRAAEEPLVRRLWHRLPWLIVGLAGAMASVLIVGAFEEQLDQVVLLAFFVPAVV